MKVSEIKGLNDADLAKQMEDARQELFNLRFRLSTRQLVNHRELRLVKQHIARLKTIARERELGIRQEK
ncbi:50S ribosomal protein L29 [Chloroflexota bacterium]